MSTEPFRLSIKGSPMSDKSPRQSMTKKTGKSIKEKRAAKRGQNDDSGIIKPTPAKKR